MAPTPRVPQTLRLRPFRGSAAIDSGLLTRAQLRRGAWRRLFPDVYIAVNVLLDHRVWCEAAVVFATRDVHPEGIAVSGPSAAHLYRPDCFDVRLPIEVTVPRARRVRSPAGLTVVRSDLARADVRPGRVPFTSPIRTAFDLARRLPRHEALAEVDALLGRRLVGLAELRAYTYAHTGWPGTPQAHEIIGLADPRSQSPMESWLRVTLIDGGLPRPAAQVAVHGADGRVIGHVDLGYEDARVGLEYEGDYHRDREVFRRDIARVNAMQDAGWIIVRVTGSDIRDPDRLVRRVRALLARRTRQSPG